MASSVIDISGPIVDPRLPLAEFSPAYLALQKSEAVNCLSTGKTISGLPAPTLAIIDASTCLQHISAQCSLILIHYFFQPFAYYAIEVIRAIAKDTLILAWWTAPAGALLRLFGPASVGGMADPSVETPEGRSVMKSKIFTQEKFEVRMHRILTNEC